MLAVIAFNCSLAVLVSGFAIYLWRWRTWLQQLTARAQTASLSPQTIGYALTLQRLRLVETRLGVAKVEMRSRQVRQGLQLIQLLRILLIYRRI